MTSDLLSLTMLLHVTHDTLCEEVEFTKVHPAGQFHRDDGSQHFSSLRSLHDQVTWQNIFLLNKDNLMLNARDSLLLTFNRTSGH